MFGRFTNSSEARKLIQDAHLCLMHLDKSTNSGRKQKSLDGLGRLKYVAESCETIPNSDYIRMIAQDLAKKDDDA